MAAGALGEMMTAATLAVSKSWKLSWSAAPMAPTKKLAIWRLPSSVDTKKLAVCSSTVRRRLVSTPWASRRRRSGS